MIEELRRKCIEETRKRISSSITDDIFIVQLVSSIEDSDIVISRMVKRLRDWYELYLPEVSKIVSNNEQFVEEIAKEKTDLMSRYKIRETMGRDFEDMEAMENLRKEIKSVILFREKQLQNLEKIMQKKFPSLTVIAGSLIGAKLISLAGSAKSLVEFPASTIQVLGAEKALFRHIRSGSKPPKYGILLGHPYVAESDDKSRAARKLADKISIAVKVDYFKGEFIGNKLKEQLK